MHCLLLLLYTFFSHSIIFNSHELWKILSPEKIHPSTSSPSRFMFYLKVLMICILYYSARVELFRLLIEMCISCYNFSYCMHVTWNVTARCCRWLYVVARILDEIVVQTSLQFAAIKHYHRNKNQ